MDVPGERTNFRGEIFRVQPHWQAADGGGAPERLLENPRIQMPLTFTPDGRPLFSEEVPGEGRNIMALRLDTRRVKPVIRTPANELTPEISPDGGRQPLWSRDGAKRLDSADYAGAGSSGASRTHDVASDGCFLMIKQGQRDAAAESPSLLLVQNWFEELKRLAPVTPK